MVDTILALPPPLRRVVLDFNPEEEAEEVLRTSAARAAASLGPDESSGACGFFPKVFPPFGAEIFGGAAARALLVCGGALAGVAPRVRPSPWKESEDWEPQQLPIVVIVL